MGRERVSRQLRWKEVMHLVWNRIVIVFENRLDDFSPIFFIFVHLFSSVHPQHTMRFSLSFISRIFICASFYFLKFRCALLIIIRLFTFCHIICFYLVLCVCFCVCVCNAPAFSFAFQSFCHLCSFMCITHIHTIVHSNRNALKCIISGVFCVFGSKFVVSFIVRFVFVLCRMLSAS